MSNTHDTQNDTDTSTDQRTTTAVIYDVIETLGGEREEAPVGMVITRAVTTSPYTLPDVLDEVNRLIINGELYQPQEVTIRPTEPAVMADGGVENPYGKAIRLEDKANQLEDFDWQAIPGISTSTAATFVDNIRDAAEQLYELDEERDA